MTQKPEFGLTAILLAAYEVAQGEPPIAAIPEELSQALHTLVEHAEHQKAVLGATITSLAYKIFRPEQDIRYHQAEMPNGYAARTIDTKYTMPFMKTHFARYAMSESAWLTRSIEQPHPFTPNFPGHIRNKSVKAAFLNVINAAQEDPHLAQPLLIELFRLLFTQNVSQAVPPVTFSGMLSIEQIVKRFEQHLVQPYKGSGTARLPVLAIYAAYQLLITDVRRYVGKSLKPLGAHTSADKRSRAAGDIEIANPDGSLFEVVEIKYRKPITSILLDDAAAKLGESVPERYYVLTTYEPNVLDRDRERVAEKISELQARYACQFIINGILPSLKYYLRLVTDPNQWTLNYTMLVENDPALKSAHRRAWQDLLGS